MSKRPQTSWVRFACLFPFLVSVLLPVGMMPAIIDGTITLVICTANGPEERSIPAPGEQSETASPWCLFSLLSAPVLPSTPIGLADDRVGEITNPILTDLDVPAHRDLDELGPRGPPSIL